MTSTYDILKEHHGKTYDELRQKYLRAFAKHTKRNVIVYYSGWLQKPNAPDSEVNDSDKNRFMAVIHGLERDKGLDLFLHTPGGDIAATESLIDYLRAMFDDDIRVFIPQLAMSAGTMIACAAKVIFMGKHSSLGPIDPQLKGGMPAHGIIEEFNTAYEEIKKDQAKIPVWQPILAKYPPTLIGECEKAITWSNTIVGDCLKTGMFRNMKDKESRDEKIDEILNKLGDHALTLSHSRHLSASTCKAMGLEIEMLEDDHSLQEKVLSVHHVCMHNLSSTTVCKLIANHKGKAVIQRLLMPS